jgi:hypothetical protein
MLEQPRNVRHMGGVITPPWQYGYSLIRKLNEYDPVARMSASDPGLCQKMYALNIPLVAGFGGATPRDLQSGPDRA